MINLIFYKEMWSATISSRMVALMEVCSIIVASMLKSYGMRLHGNSDLQNECLLEVGNGRDLSISASLGPIISISLTTMCTNIENCLISFTRTMFCPIPTPIGPGAPLQVSSTLSNNVNAQTSSFAFLSSSMPPISTPPAANPLISTSLVAMPVATLLVLTETILPSIASSEFGRQAESSSVSAPIILTTNAPQEVNMGLFAGIAVAVAVLVLLVILTAVVLLVCVVKKKRENRRQRDLSLTDYSTVNEHSASLQTNRIDNNIDREPSIKENEAYGKFTEETIDECDYVFNSLAETYDPSITQNLAYGDVATTEYSVIATDDNIVNGFSGTAEVAMIRNEAYVEIRQSSSDNDPSIPTTENEVYTSVTADTEVEEIYDYVC
ncbi:uncharacterized protein LOC135351673 isoform X2 [Halichondria panicea]|uniref:uncharacterized protein LOC135351673 isoform X2 n=1 Tax=Halichondria panicea TaxID=6063 RepID=UPI00312B93B2